MRRVAVSGIVALASVLVAAPARGQSAYVTAVAGADISRFSRADSAGGGAGGLNGGETLLFGLRVGTSLSDRWGVELEFARPSALEEERRRIGGPVILAEARSAARRTGSPVPVENAPSTGIIRPVPVDFEVDLQHRTTTLSALAWARQRAGSSVDLVYLGGLSFNRTVREIHAEFVPFVIGRPGGARVTEYGVGPVAGIEARIRMTEHVRLVPGVRIHGLGGPVSEGWLIRLGTGLSWSF